MSDNDVFSPAGTDDQSASAPVADPMSELVGEGKKYKTVEDAVQAFYHAQNHIANLEHENREAREALDELNRQASGNQQVLDALKQQNTPSQESPTSGTPDEEAVRKLVEQVVEQKSSAQIKADNLKYANDKASELFGHEAKAKVEEAAKNLNISVEMLKSTAESSPTAFLKLIGANVGANTTPPVRGASPPPSDVNSQQLDSGSASGEKNFAYYNKLRRENPKLFKTVQVQREMMQQRGKLGEKFFT